MANVNLDTFQFTGGTDTYVIPVKSVNSKTGTVSLDASDISAVPVSRTVNNKPLSADITLTASDVGAGTYSKPSGGIPASDLASAVQTSLGKADTALQTAPVTSVNGNTGAVVLSIPSTASDVGAIAAPSSPSSGQFLVYNGSAWTAQTVPSASGVSF